MVVILVGTVNFTVAKATTVKLHNYLNCSVHLVPILKDTATASTCVSNTDNYSDTSVQSKTVAYAYNKDGSYDKDTNTASGGGAMEGRGSATASMRAMVKARGVHKGTCASYNGWVSDETSWKK